MSSDPQNPTAPDPVTICTYDALGGPTSVRDGPGPVTWTAYDDGRVTGRGAGPAPGGPSEAPPDEPHIVE